MQSRCTGLEMAYTGIVGSVLMRMRYAAMATETHRSRFETFWHGDGLNVQPERLKRFYGA